jgi:hypothetical protein
VFDDPGAQGHGRSGQAQYGVVFASSAEFVGPFWLR